MSSVCVCVFSDGEGMYRQLLDRYGIRVVVIGRKDLLPADIRASVERVEAMTVHNTQGCLNVAFPYSSQEEMASAMYTSAMEAVCGHGGRQVGLGKRGV